MIESDRFGFSVLSRRRWLRLTLGAGVAVAGGGAAVRWLRGPPAPDGAALSPGELATAVALARALFPPGGAFPQGADDLDLGRAFGRFLADEPPWNQADLKRALFLLEVGPLLFERRMVRFSTLGSEEALSHVERCWALSSSLLRRQVALAFRKFFALVFYDSESVWPAIGYPGPSLAALAGGRAPR